MKRILLLLVLMFSLAGCTDADSALDRAMVLRNKLSASQGCSFEATVTADYGEKIYTFAMKCSTDSNGLLTFEVTAPETIQGITGTVSEEGGKLTFDESALMFETIADGQITPVSAPWLLVHTLCGGYINACGYESNGLYMQIDDSYEDNALHMEIWTGENDLPMRAEVLWQGRRIVSMDVESFTIL